MTENNIGKSSFAICINNEGYKASLETGKLYRMIPDQKPSTHGYLRIIDESGEDYGYSSDRFFFNQITVKRGKSFN